MPVWIGMRIMKRRRTGCWYLHADLPEGYSCVLAPLTAEMAICTMVPVHAFNLHSYPVVIRQESVNGGGEHHLKM